MLSNSYFLKRFVLSYLVQQSKTYRTIYAYYSYRQTRNTLETWITTSHALRLIIFVLIKNSTILSIFVKSSQSRRVFYVQSTSQIIARYYSRIRYLARSHRIYYFARPQSYISLALLVSSRRRSERAPLTRVLLSLSLSTLVLASRTISSTLAIVISRFIKGRALIVSTPRKLLYIASTIFEIFISIQQTLVLLAYQYLSTIAQRSISIILDLRSSATLSVRIYSLVSFRRYIFCIRQIDTIVFFASDLLSKYILYFYDLQSKIDRTIAIQRSLVLRVVRLYIEIARYDSISKVAFFLRIVYAIYSFQIRARSSQTSRTLIFFFQSTIQQILIYILNVKFSRAYRLYLVK